MVQRKVKEVRRVFQGGGQPVQRPWGRDSKAAIVVERSVRGRGKIEKQRVLRSQAK